MKHRIQMQVLHISVSLDTYICVKVTITLNSSTHNFIHYKSFCKFEFKIVFQHTNPETNVSSDISVYRWQCFNSNQDMSWKQNHFILKWSPPSDRFPLKNEICLDHILADNGREFKDHIESVVALRIWIKYPIDREHVAKLGNV